ncbi:MAG: histidinol-phosphate transaminase [Ilumatobacteraceae bacterium]
MPELRPEIAAMPGYHSPQVDVPIRLNTNESPFPPPEAFVSEFTEAIQDVSWNRYPDRTASRLRDRLAVYHGVQPEQLFVANGSNEVLQTILLAYAGPGRRVVVFEPGYQMHVQIARILGSEVIVIERNEDFTLDGAHVREVLREVQPHLVFLSSPNNPTGQCDDESMIDIIGEATDAMLVVDEAYAEFSSWSAIDRALHSDRIVVSRTFSKTWSLAALRLGYLIGSSDVIGHLWTAVLPYHLDSVKQIAGELALKFTDDMNERVSLIVSERERVQTALIELDVDVSPSSANFVLFKTRRDADFMWSALLDHGVLVRNCSSWPRLEGWLRLTIGTEDENNAFLAGLQSALEKE